METKQLGHSDLQITPIGVGAWAIGGAGWSFSWGPQEDAESIRAIHAALDAGMNWIDTAAVYGLGHSERIVAEALRQYSGQRPYVFTKCGRNWDASGQICKVLKASAIRQECEDSLRRLGVDCIDLYQIHWPEPDEDIEEGWETLAALQHEGKVRWIGVSNFNVAQLERAESIAPIASLQPPYSMIRREIEAEILPYVQRAGIGVLAYSPMGSGLLTGTMSRARLANLPDDDWRRRSLQFQEPLLTRNLKIAELVERFAKGIGQSPGVLAIAWVLRNPAVTGAIVGIRTPEQVRGIAAALQFRLDEAVVTELEDELRQIG